MILIADSGATKTDWCFGTPLHHSQIVQPEGITPFHQDANKIYEILRNGLFPQLPCPSSDIQAVFFYGAGCTPVKIEKLTSLFSRLFPHAAVEVHSDLLGAARAPCPPRAGPARNPGPRANPSL